MNAPQNSIQFYEATLRAEYDELVADAEGSTSRAAEKAVEYGLVPEELIADVDALFFRWHMEGEFGVAFARDWFAGKVRW